MKKKLFVLLLALITIAGFLLKIYPLAGNNIFFTVDQGRDAVYVREILQQGRFFLKGPETSIRGVFVGPLWYYFIAVGYLVSGGHPIGAALMLILLSLATTIFLVVWLARRVNKWVAILIGASLQIFWGFFETSLWGFNPFPTATLVLLQVIFLTEFIDGKQKHYIYALVPVLFALNADLAPAAVMLIFYILAGFWGFRKKIIRFKTYLIFSLVLPLAASAIMVRQFITQFLQNKVVSTGAGLGVFTGTNFSIMLPEFAKIIASTTIPQNVAPGIAVLVLIVLLYLKTKNKSKYVRTFFLLSLILITTSFLFFSSNKGWRSWHTTYLPPLIFVAILLILSQVQKKIAIPIFTIILGAQIINFYQQYSLYLKPSPNPSILYNEISTIDWVYKKAENQGFRVYNYTDTFYDYPYQYLFWWHGARKYGYLPDEYSNFPLSHKELYVPGYSFYQEPKRNGEDLKFLIIQSQTNGEQNKDWITKFRAYHNLIESTKIGDIIIEMYKKKSGSPNDLCLWWNRCQ